MTYNNIASGTVYTVCQYEIKRASVFMYIENPFMYNH